MYSGVYRGHVSHLLLWLWIVFILELLLTGNTTHYNDVVIMTGNILLNLFRTLTTHVRPQVHRSSIKSWSIEDQAFSIFPQVKYSMLTHNTGHRRVTGVVTTLIRAVVGECSRWIMNSFSKYCFLSLMQESHLWFCHLLSFNLPILSSYNTQHYLLTSIFEIPKHCDTFLYHLWYIQSWL